MRVLSGMQTLITYLPFWLFLMLFKFGAGLHYTILSPLGARVFPIWIVGVFIGCAALVQMLLDVPAGHLLDRFGRLRLLRVSTVVFMFAACALFFPFSSNVFLVTLVLSICGWLFYTPGANAYVLSHARPTEAGRFMSLKDVAGSTGIVLASAVLGLVLLLPTQYIGGLIFALLGLSLVGLYMSPPDKELGRVPKKIETHHYYIRRKHPLRVLAVFSKLNPAALMLFLLNFSGAVFYAVVWFVVPLIIAQNVASSGVLGVGLGIFDFAVVILGYLLGTLADKGNKRILVFFGLIIFAVSGAVTGSNFGWLFLLFGFIATTGEELAGLSLWSWLHSLDREHAHDGLVAGMLTLGEDMGWALGPMVAGVLYTLLGPGWTIFYGASLIFATWMVYILMLRLDIRTPVIDLPLLPTRRKHKS